MKFLFQLLSLFLASSLFGLDLKVLSVKEDVVQFEIENKTQENVILSALNQDIVFLGVEIWDSDLGAKLISPDLAKISDNGGFVVFDELIVLPKQKLVKTIKISSFVTRSEKGESVKVNFLKRNSKNRANFFKIRLFLIKDKNIASNLFSCSSKSK